MMKLLYHLLLIVSGYYFFRLLYRLTYHCWKVISPALFWSGLIWPALIGLVASFGIKVNLAFWIVAWAVCAYVLAQNLIRSHTHNPAFSFVEHFTQNQKLKRGK